MVFPHCRLHRCRLHHHTHLLRRRLVADYPGFLYMIHRTLLCQLLRAFCYYSPSYISFPRSYESWQRNGYAYRIYSGPDIPHGGRVLLLSLQQLLQHSRPACAFFDHYMRFSLSQIAMLSVVGSSQIRMSCSANLTDAPAAPFPVFAVEVAYPLHLSELFFSLAQFLEPFYCNSPQIHFCAVPDYF